MSLKTAFKLLLPVAFFGYALLGNLALFAAPDLRLPALDGIWKGGTTAEIDTLYRENLPHKSPAVGLIGAARYTLLHEGRKGVVVGHDGRLFTAEEFRASAEPPAAYTDALEQIGGIAAELRTQGAALVVAPVPAKSDLLARFSPDPEAPAQMQALYGRFIADLTAQGVPAVDTRPALDALEAPFLRTDTHWTPEGARAVAARIAGSGLVDTGETAFTQTPEAPKEFAGDLVRYITSDTLAPRLGLAPERVAPYHAVAQSAPDAGAALDIFGSAAAPDQLDLVGTSYSANPNWSFAEALRLELGRDVINHAQEGQGPFGPMKDYLAQRSADESGTVVLWEIPLRYLLDPEMVAKGGPKA